MEVVDYHVHSNNSFDGKNSIEEMCRKAIEKNLSEICFTEHFSVDPRDVSYRVLDYEKYFSEIIKAKEKFSDRIRIKCGMEIGEPHLKQYQEDLVKEIENMNLDFIIGSVHNIDGIKLRLYMQNKNKYDIYYDYFSEIYKMVKSSDIDIVGHMDLMKRYAYEAHGNYPGKKVLDLYRNLGGEVMTVGSDSHFWESLAIHNIKMINLLKETGFKYIFTYEKRKKIPLKI